ncbi:MAG: transcription elongation factor GreA [Planctomycetia bacterium]|nr:transcription elongation factor GreA [Planctomycetia bacterium]
MAEFYMTQSGYDKLRAELEQMEHVEMPAILERIATARAEGDLRENAEYHGARESLGMLEAKMSEIRYKLSMAEIIDESTIPTDEVAFGCTVRLKDLDFDEEETLTLVGSGEEDSSQGKILATSPMAMGLMGKKVGEIAEVEVPAGRLRFEVLEISR